MRTAPVAILVVSLVAAPAARAQPRPADEARAHFNRAVTLYADSNYEAALVEFQRAMEISNNLNLLYNLGAVYEALGRFVEARDALEAYRMRGTPSAVTARAAELDARIARLRERIGTLRVLVDAPGLRARLDGVEVPVARLRAGMPVSAGVRVLTLEADGFATREERREVTGSQTVVIEGSLEALRAMLDVQSEPDGAEVVIDGRAVGETPLAAPPALPYGAHEVVLRRAGYRAVTRRVELGPAGARVAAALAWDDPLDERVAARISLRCNVSHPSVALDGRPVRSDGAQPVPPGRHTLRVERAGYVPVERAITLRPGENELSQWLDATPALRAQHDARVRRARTPAYVLMSVGGALLAGGAPLLITGLIDNRESADEYTALEAQRDRCGISPNAPGCVNASGFVDFAPALSAAQGRVDDGALRAIVGGGLVGVGAVGVVVGAVLFARSGSLGGFDRPPSWSLRVAPTSAAVTVAF